MKTICLSSCPALAPSSSRWWKNGLCSHSPALEPQLLLCHQFWKECHCEMLCGLLTQYCAIFPWDSSTQVYVWCPFVTYASTDAASFMSCTHWARPPTPPLRTLYRPIPRTGYKWSWERGGRWGAVLPHEPPHLPSLGHLGEWPEGGGRGGGKRLSCDT